MHREWRHDQPVLKVLCEKALGNKHFARCQLNENWEGQGYGRYVVIVRVDSPTRYGAGAIEMSWTCGLVYILQIGIVRTSIRSR